MNAVNHWSLLALPTNITQGMTIVSISIPVTMNGSLYPPACNDVIITMIVLYCVPSCASTQAMMVRSYALH